MRVNVSEKVANCLLIEHRNEALRFGAALSLHEQLQRLAFFNVEELNLENFQLANCTFYIGDIGRLSAKQRENLANTLAAAANEEEEADRSLIIVGTALSEPEMRLMGLLKDPLLDLLNNQRIRLAAESLLRFAAEQAPAEPVDLH